MDSRQSTATMVPWPAVAGPAGPGTSLALILAAIALTWIAVRPPGTG